MIKRSFIAAGIGLALSGTAFAEGAGKTSDKAARSPANDTTASAIAKCDKLTGAQKATCLQQAREDAGRSATGATGSGASGRAGAAGSEPQSKETAPGKAGSSRAY